MTHAPAREWLAKVRTQGQQHCFVVKSAQSVCGGAQRTDGRWEVRTERPRCLQCVQRLRERETPELKP
jgi:hypothetical protein